MKQTFDLEQYKTMILGFSQRKVAKFLGVPRTTIQDYLVRNNLDCYGNEVDKFTPEKLDNIVLRQYDKEYEDNSRILVISDMHIPYQHPKTLEFLQGLKDKYSPTRIVCVGDELDKSSLSYHEHDPNLYSAGDELEASKKVIAKLQEMFPVMDILESNHGSLVYRKAKTHGIPKQYIRDYNEVLGVDDGWKWHFDLTLKLPTGQHVYFHHGKSADGLKLSQTMGMCAVQGHYHEKFKIDYWANPLGLYWSMQVGCLIHDDSLAFAYNNVNIKRPIIGCGLIIDGVPILEAMPL